MPRVPRLEPPWLLPDAACRHPPEEPGSSRSSMAGGREARRRRRGREPSSAPGPLTPHCAPTELQLAFVDWHGLENTHEHHTAEMSSGQLAVRRGQPFTLTLHFHSRNYEPGFDSLHLVAETGKGGEGGPQARHPRSSRRELLLPHRDPAGGASPHRRALLLGNRVSLHLPTAKPPSPRGPSGTKAASADGRLGPEVCVGGCWE